MKSALKRIGIILGVLVLVGTIGVAWIAHSLKKALEPTVSIEKYGEVLTDWKATGLVDHFPGSVPPDAKNVKFSSFPGFLQGGGHIQLRMELPENQTEKRYASAMTKAKQHHDGGNSRTLVNREDDGLASTNPHTLGSGTYEFPPDYRVFIFDAEPYKKGSGFDWNHGASKGVAISLERNEVIYYAERW